MDRAAIVKVICSSFRASPQRDGLILLEIESPDLETAYERMSMQQVADFIGRSTKTVSNLANRSVDPLPLRRGKGRPFALRSELTKWMSQNGHAATNGGARPTRRRRSGNLVRDVYG
jgi:hypothetical protein